MFLHVIVTLKLAPTKFKACLSKRGGMGVGAWESGPGGEFTSRIKARARSYPQVIHNLSYLILDTTSSILGIKKGRYVGYRPLVINTLGETIVLNLISLVSNQYLFVSAVSIPMI